jgi:hypothetical protein
MKNFSFGRVDGTRPQLCKHFLICGFWYSSQWQRCDDTLHWLVGQLAEQQLTQGRHFLLYQPYTVDPWTNIVQYDRVKHMMYRRDLLESQIRSQRHAPTQHCAWLTTSRWELMWPFGTAKVITSPQGRMLPNSQSIGLAMKHE